MDERNTATSQSRTRAAVVLGLLAAGIPAAAAMPEIRYRETWGYGVVVAVHVQGVGPLDFLLDTGADSTVVHPDLAQRLGLKPTGQVELITLAGARYVPQATATVALGEATLGPIEVLIHDLAAARAADPHLVGILGRNALRRTSFTLDHGRRRVVLGRVPGGAGVPYEDVEGRTVVDARLRCDGEPIRMALDSGVGAVVLFQRSRPLPVDAPDTVRAHTNTGETRLRAGRLDALCLGPTRMLDVPVAVQEAEAAAGRIEDGLLPTRLFRRVHFDLEHRTVRVEPW
jgi:predicted aspartyl protease